MPSRNKFYSLQSGWNFISPRQAAGVAPALGAKGLWDPKSRVREGGQEYGVFVQEAVSGGSAAATISLYVVESDSIAPVTLPDTTVVTTKLSLVDILQGPSFNADGFDASNPAKFIHIFQQVPL